MVTKRDPGSLLGLLITIGSVVAALVIQRRSVYKLIPLPALTYLVLATATGAYHDRSLDTSKTALAANFLQWIGGGFFAMSAATILVLLVFFGRLLASRQLVAGRLTMAAQQPPQGAPRGGRPRGGLLAQDDGLRGQGGFRENPTWEPDPRVPGPPDDLGHGDTQVLWDDRPPPGNRHAPPGPAPRSGRNAAPADPWNERGRRDDPGRWS